MKRLALLAALIATPALAQQPPQPKPSQALAGQLATALAQAQDRIAELEAMIQAEQAKHQPPATPAPAPAAPVTTK